MKTTSLGVVAVILLVPACSGWFRAGAPSSSAAAGKPLAQHSAARAKGHAKSHAADATSQPAQHPGLAVGDYFVERFSGSFRHTPLTLTEEVVATEGELLVVDYTLAETGNPKAQHLRTRLNPATQRVERVSVMAGDREIPAPLAAYDRLIEKTSFAADTNDGIIGSEDQTCLVGEREIACKTRDYKVRIGDAPATLSVTTSEAVAGRDVAGQIVTGDGNVVYRAELVDMRRGSGSSSVAAR